MAGPWHPSKVVNNSLHVTFKPRRRLAALWLTGHSVANISSRAIGLLPKANIRPWAPDPGSAEQP